MTRNPRAPSQDAAPPQIKVGDVVRFHHMLVTSPGFLVTRVDSEDGMIEIVGFTGRFAPHLFKIVADPEPLPTTQAWCGGVLSEEVPFEEDPPAPELPAIKAGDLVRYEADGRIYVVRHVEYLPSAPIHAQEPIAWLEGEHGYFLLRGLTLVTAAPAPERL
jgi:hypothetical protein